MKLRTLEAQPRIFLCGAGIPACLVGNRAEFCNVREARAGKNACPTWTFKAHPCVRAEPGK